MFPFVNKVKTLPQFNRSDEKVREFYTIRILSLDIEHYTAPTTTSSSSLKDLPENGSVYQLSLSANTYILPSRLKGRIPSPTTHEVVEQEKEWVSLMKQSHGFGTTGATSLISTIGSAAQQQLLSIHNFKSYSLDVCATPGCDKAIPASEILDHLNLCNEHQSKLDTVLKQYQKSYDIILPPDISSDEVHQMVYYSVLPNIDDLLRKLSSSADQHTRYVVQALKAFKTCIFLYRMHLNPMSNFIQTIVGLFLNAFEQSETTMRRLVSAILKLLVVSFAICGIFLIWAADLILSDDAYLSILLMAAGGGLAYWGGAASSAAAALVVAAPPIAAIVAISAGLGLFSIGLFMFIERVQRAAPHEYVVRAHANLGDVEDYLRQWIRNPFRDGD